VAELRSTLKNNQNAYYPRFTFTAKTGKTFPETGVYSDQPVLFLHCEKSREWRVCAPVASHVAVQQDGEECIVIVILCSALSSRMIERIFSGAVTRGSRHASAHDKMSYTEFVWFLLSEEDKTHPTAIEYWFRCMDLDGDGYLSMYELEYFYEEQLQRMDAIGMETLPFEDCLCQVTFYTDLI